MGNRLIRFYILITLISVLAYSCINSTEEDDLFLDHTIRLRWFPGAFDQSKEEVRTGFAWTLSSLGAMLPAESMDQVMIELDENLFEIDLSRAGFSEEALGALNVVLIRLKNSHAYQVNNYVEMGRFVMLTLNSSNHYYEITRVPKTIADFRSRYSFDGEKMRIINSSVSLTQRLLEIATANQFEEIAYVAVEGEGSFEDDSFQKKEFEVLDFMPNGQLRFAIYDTNGTLKPAADEELTKAGKLSKCLWCHETNIQPLFRENAVLAGDNFLSEDEFNVILDRQNLFLAEHRDALNSEIDFSNLRDHRFLEYLYIDFMEPSADRIALEWGMSKEAVEILLGDIPTHVQLEYNIPEVYHRIDIENLAPFTSTEVPESAREPSSNEPNFFLF